MTQILWTQDLVHDNGVCERGFAIEREGQVIPGVLWSPVAASGLTPAGRRTTQATNARAFLALVRRSLLLPVDAVGADAPLDLTNRMRIVLQSNVERIQPGLCSEPVDEALHGE